MKPWYQSRTIWANIATAVITACVAVGQYVTGHTIPIDPAVQGTIVSGFLVVLNLFMRTITGQPLG